MSDLVNTWVFCFDQRASGWFERMIKVAVISAAEHTSLRPVCLYDGDHDTSIVHWLKSHNVEVVRTQVPFRDELFSGKVITANAGSAYHPEHAAGAFLRIVSPDYIEDEFFLYTDCDVMFTGDPTNLISAPAIFGACPEIVLTNDGAIAHDRRFNSGVLVIDRERFLAERDHMVTTFRAHNFYDRASQSYDQTILNRIFDGRWDGIDGRLNWRPFQGENTDARIVHFHGPKPHRIDEIMAGNGNDGEQGVMTDMIENNRASYQAYLEQFKYYQAHA